MKLALAVPRLPALSLICAVNVCVPSARARLEGRVTLASVALFVKIEVRSMPSSLMARLAVLIPETVEPAEPVRSE